MMNVRDAAYVTVHDQPGGCAALAVRMAMNPATLNKKVDPHCQTHHMTIAEADRLMGLTHDHRILHALAANHSFACVALPKVGAAPVLDEINAVVREFSEYLGEVSKTVADNRVTADERRRCERELQDLIAHSSALLSLLQVTAPAGGMDGDGNVQPLRAATMRGPA
jgi:hypothetical protein